ncbi:hypothetical protein L246_25380, partial [Salmonella enterica subsp. enterica serovar Worthington str. BCH-5715]
MTIWEISEKADYIAQRHRRLQDQWHIYCNSLVQGITLSKARLHHAMSCAPERDLCFVLFEHFRIYVALADGFNVVLNGVAVKTIRQRDVNTKVLKQDKAKIPFRR